MFINKSPKRGVVIYAQCQLNDKECETLSSTEFNESVWCEFMHGNNYVLIGCIYRSPTSTMENAQKLYNLINNEYIKQIHKVCIVGDFNYPNIKWDGEWTGNQDNEFIESIRDAMLIQMVKNPTRRRAGQASNILYLILVNEESLISQIEHCCPIAKSDHETLIFTMYTDACKINENETKYRFNLHKGNYDLMRHSVDGINWSNVLSGNTEECWDNIKNKILSVMEEFIPTTKIKNSIKTCPRWMNRASKKLIKKEVQFI